MVLSVEAQKLEQAPIADHKDIVPVVGAAVVPLENVVVVVVVVEQVLAVVVEEEAEAEDFAMDGEAGPGCLLSC